MKTFKLLNISGMVEQIVDVVETTGQTFLFVGVYVEMFGRSGREVGYCLILKVNGDFCGGIAVDGPEELVQEKIGNCDG